MSMGFSQKPSKSINFVHIYNFKSVDLCVFTIKSPIKNKIRLQAGSEVGIFVYQLNFPRYFTGEQPIFCLN